jgi:hypothetical protein
MYESMYAIGLLVEAELSHCCAVLTHTSPQENLAKSCLVLRYLCMHKLCM